MKVILAEGSQDRKTREAGLAKAGWDGKRGEEASGRSPRERCNGHASVSIWTQEPR